MVLLLSYSEIQPSNRSSSSGGRRTIDGDGRPDLAIADSGSGSHTVSILLNRGDGTFQSAVRYPVGKWTQAVIAADLNGDGRTDLATANRSSSSSSVFLNQTTPPFSLDLNRSGVPDECERFRRGDPNADGKVDLSDAIYVLNWLFVGGAKPGCWSAADGNGDKAVEISDPVYLLNHLFLGGPPPPAPFPQCGAFDPARDDPPGCETPPEKCP